ncbi:MAG: DUF362 domain-containing protein [Acetivibrionales bacterium]|jgi:hypothetical protein
MSVLSDLVKDFKIPKMIKVRQNFPRPVIPAEDVPDTLRKVIDDAGVLSRIKEGDVVAIAGSSRGIANAPIFYRELVSIVKEQGGKPFIFPAMGSHGGATAEGQKLVLESMGITEEFCGCPIRSTMETVIIGHTEKNNLPVNLDKYAYDADCIILFNRIKLHTSFRGDIESGLAKMSVIGIGKQKGAELCHSIGLEYMHDRIVEISDYVYKHSKVIFGIGVIENAYDETADVVCLKTEEIHEKEPALLKKAISLMASICFKNYDILILDEIGKNISGTGMDCNIVSRFTSDTMPAEKRQQIITVLDLSEETHGNANGIGISDISTKRVWDKLDLEATYANPLTSLVIKSPKIPLIMENDQSAIQASIKFCLGIDRTKPRIVRIKNTLEVSEMYISEALLEEAKKFPFVEILSDPEEMAFDENGNLF